MPKEQRITYQNAASSFKLEWLHMKVETNTPKSRDKIEILLKEIFTYESDVGIVCKYCLEAKVTGDFTTGKKYKDVWKLEFLKRHLITKSHVDAVVKLRNQNSSLPTTSLVCILQQSPEERERKRSTPKEVKVLIDSVLLAIKMNNSLNSVQDINDHMAKYTNIPNSWRGKNYAFEFTEIINGIVEKD